MKAFLTYTVPIAIALVMVFVVASVIGLNGIRDEAVLFSQQEMEQRIQTLWELLRIKGHPYSLVDGTLRAGEYVVNGNNELPDTIQMIFGGTATIFMGDTRVSTNVKKADGSRAVGTRLVGPAYEAIFNNGVSYRGSADILGKQYYTAYDPIRNSSGDIIGVLYVGVEKNIFLAQFDSLRMKIIAIISSLIALSLLLYLIIIRQGLYTKETLMEHQSRLTDIINFLPDATWAIDITGSVIAWNKAIEELTGVASENIIGRNNFEYALPFYGERRPILIDAAIQPNPEQEQKYESFSRSGDKVEAEIFVPHFRAGGVYFWGSARRLRDSSGRVIGAIETIRDITERKRMQENMLQTEKMVMIGGMAAGMAHEINNPLGAILQHAQNIERRVSEDIPANLKAAEEVGVRLELVRAYLEKRGIFEFIGHIRTAGVKASDIISNMLQFSRHSHSGAEVVTLASLLDKSLELVGSDYDMKKKYDFSRVEVLRDYGADLPQVSLVVGEMEQVLLIVLKNAVQATAPTAVERKPLIIVRTRCAEGMVVLQIEDNGTGMDEATRLRVFEPFFTTREVGSGTGLGLSVAYAIVTKGHHGVIEVQSRSGEGSCFTIKLPVPGRA